MIDDKRNGFGTMYYIDEAKYSGEWENDMRIRYGIIYFQNTDKYEG